MYYKFEEWNRDSVGQIGHSLDSNTKGRESEINERNKKLYCISKKQD